MLISHNRDSRENTIKKDSRENRGQPRPKSYLVSWAGHEGETLWASPERGWGFFSLLKSPRTQVLLLLFLKKKKVLLLLLVAAAPARNEP